jgi:hypothetical protein
VNINQGRPPAPDLSRTSGWLLEPPPSCGSSRTTLVSKSVVASALAALRLIGDSCHVALDGGGDDAAGSGFPERHRPILLRVGRSLPVRNQPGPKRQDSARFVPRLSPTPTLPRLAKRSFAGRERERICASVDMLPTKEMLNWNGFAVAQEPHLVRNHGSRESRMGLRLGTRIVVGLLAHWHGTCRARLAACLATSARSCTYCT